jgi:hypothetical protein
MTKKYQLTWRGLRSNMFYTVTRITIDVEVAQFRRGPWKGWTFDKTHISALLTNLFQGKFPSADEFKIT